MIVEFNAKIQCDYCPATIDISMEDIKETNPNKKILSNGILVAVQRKYICSKCFRKKDKREIVQ